MGFLLVKDVIIRVCRAATNSENSVANSQSDSQAAGGILCFSYSKSSSSKSEARASNFKAYSHGFEIKIPGPQILGYIMQSTDTDDAQGMPKSLPANFFISDDEYDKNVAGGGGKANAPALPAHRQAPPDANPSETVHDVLERLLTSRLDEIFRQVKTEIDKDGKKTKA